VTTLVPDHRAHRRRRLAREATVVLAREEEAAAWLELADELAEPIAVHTLLDQREQRTRRAIIATIFNQPRPEPQPEPEPDPEPHLLADVVGYTPQHKKADQERQPLGSLLLDFVAELGRGRQ
jgi:hypothetical protein